MYYLLQHIDSMPTEYAIVDLTTGNFHGSASARKGGTWFTDITALVRDVREYSCRYIDDNFDDIPHSTIHEYTAFLRADPGCVSCNSIANFSTIEDILNITQTHPELFL